MCRCNFLPEDVCFTTVEKTVFSVVLFSLFCQCSVGYISMSLFLVLLFCSFDLFVLSILPLCLGYFTCIINIAPVHFKTFFKCTIYLKVRKIQIKIFPSIGSVSKCSQPLGLVQPKAWSCQLILGLHVSCREPRT